MKHGMVKHRANVCPVEECREAAEAWRPTVDPLVDPAASRSMALRLLRRLGPKATGERFDERHTLRPGTGERQLYRLLTGLRWGVTHAGPRPAEQVRETTEDRLWVLL